MRRPKKAKTPFADSAIAKYLDSKFESIKGIKTEAEIATECWYDDPKYIARLRRGENPVPLDRISMLALAIDCHPVHLLRLALEQHYPGVQETLAEYLGAIATPNEEFLFLRKWRQATDNTDPGGPDEVLDAIDRMMAELKTVMSKT